VPLPESLKIASHITLSVSRQQFFQKTILHFSIGESQHIFVKFIVIAFDGEVTGLIKDGDRVGVFRTVIVDGIGCYCNFRILKSACLSMLTRKVGVPVLNQ
jgi:hypothetical protein